MKNYFKLLLVMVLGAIINSCTYDRSKDVKNVIYLIGDGMGFGAVSTALMTHDQETGFEMAHAVGFHETSSADNHVTDSPAGGTALATGKRTRNGYLGLDPDGNQLTSILKKAQAMGKRTGIVVNTTLTEATPAAFYAGVKSRSEGYKIAEQFVESGVDVAIGSGLSVFNDRPDSVDLIWALKKKKYEVYFDWKHIVNPSADRFVAILPMSQVHRRNQPQVSRSAENGAVLGYSSRLASEGTTYAGDKTDISNPREYLSVASLSALETLEKGAKNGYFLMIESAIIDGYGHNNDSEGMKLEMYDFNNTLMLLVDYVHNHPNTLLVVTADHETGGTGIGYKSHEVGKRESLDLTFSTKGHTGTLVPVFAYGPGSECFAGIMKNTDIPKKLESLMKNDFKTRRSKI
jgi:alkaline phosphatase